MSKVTVIGAGMVGATCANVLAMRNVADEIVLIDIKEGLSEGKMLDMSQASASTDSKSNTINAATSATGRFQFSVENGYNVRYLTPTFSASSTNWRTATAPA